MQLQKREKTNQPKNQKPREKAGDAFLFLSLDILPFLCSGGGMWQWLPWARRVCVSKNRRECSMSCCPLAGPCTPFAFLGLPPAWLAGLDASWARLPAAGVYGLVNWREPRFTWSLAVWNRIHEAFSCAGGRRAVISKRGAERAAEGSNYLSCHCLIHQRVWASAPSKRDKSRTEYPSIVGRTFISLRSNISPWWALSL